MSSSHTATCGSKRIKRGAKTISPHAGSSSPCCGCCCAWPGAAAIRRRNALPRHGLLLSRRIRANAGLAKRWPAFCKPSPSCPCRCCAVGACLRVQIGNQFVEPLRINGLRGATRCMVPCPRLRGSMALGARSRARSKRQEQAAYSVRGSFGLHQMPMLASASSSLRATPTRRGACVSAFVMASSSRSRDLPTMPRSCFW